ncbi:MAG: hypothetical protein OXF33_12750 [Rhodospirillales bacterium]|nr:hypothetical protein [Rhodospirillales bacterium]
MIQEHLTIRGFRTTMRRIVSAVVGELRQIAQEDAHSGERRPARDRRIEMLNAYRQGASLRAVGEQFGVSGSRVQQILKSMPDYQAARDAARSHRRGATAGARPAQFHSLHRTSNSREVRRSWKAASDGEDVFERLYRMRAAGKKWKDLAEAVGRPPDRSNAHSTMLHMKRQAKAKGRPWPIKQAHDAAQPSRAAGMTPETDSAG